MSSPASPSLAGCPDEMIPAHFVADITDPRAYAEPERLHSAFSWFRSNQPVVRIDNPNFDPFWLVTKHQDILDIERQADVFHNGDRSTVLAPADMLAAIEGVMHSPHLTRAVVNMDGREHRAYRMLTQSWFMPANVKKLSDRIRGIAQARVENMLANGPECDFVADVALHYPLHVIMEILGVPEADEAKMLVLTQQLFGARDPELSRSSSAMDDPATGLAVFQAVLRDFYDYFRAITQDRRANPRGDLATIIANAVINGEQISDHEANSYYVLVATAGHDTTSASIACALWALAERPDQLAKIHEDPALITQLVDEAIRWATPVKHFMRTATQDYELRGQSIKRGDWVMLSYMSANRDEAVFENPFEFRVDRAGNKQLAFGFGPHVCLGQHLARLEMQILLEELLPRIKSIEIAGEPKWTQSTFLSGLKKLPVRFDTF